MIRRARTLDQILLDDDRVARRVDAYRGRLHLAETLGVEEAARLGLQIRVDGDEIRLTQEHIEIDRPGVQLGLGFLVAMGVVKGTGMSQPK